MTTDAITSIAEAEKGTSLWHDAWLRLRKNRMAVFGLFTLVLAHPLAQLLAIGLGPAFQYRLHALIPFLVTRQILAGAGRVSGPGGDGGVAYQVSQRADFFDCVFSDRASASVSVTRPAKSLS